MSVKFESNKTMLVALMQFTHQVDILFNLTSQLKHPYQYQKHFSPCQYSHHALVFVLVFTFALKVRNESVSMTKAVSPSWLLPQSNFHPLLSQSINSMHTFKLNHMSTFLKTFLVSVQVKVHMKRVTQLSYQNLSLDFMK